MKTSMKRQRLAKWTKKPDPTIDCLQETYSNYIDKDNMNVKGCKKVYYANFNQTKIGVVILISIKIYFRAKKKLPNDRDRHYIINYK